MQKKMFPARPPRLNHIFSGTRPLYFLTFNTYRRRSLLARPQVDAIMRQFCGRAEDRGVAVGRYVIMPDHIHLFAALTPQQIGLAQWVQSLRSIIGKRLLELGQQKPHWQEGFFDHLLRNDESYAQKWQYVRMNPVRAGLAATPEQWPYQGEILPLSYD